MRGGGGDGEVSDVPVEVPPPPPPHEEEVSDVPVEVPPPSPPHEGEVSDIPVEVPPPPSDSGSEESDGSSWICTDSADAVQSPFGGFQYIRIFTAPWEGLAILCNDARDGIIVFYDFEIHHGQYTYTLAEHQFWLMRLAGDHDEAVRSFAMQLEVEAYLLAHDPDGFQTMDGFVEMYMDVHQDALVDIWYGDVPPSSAAEDYEGGEEEDYESGEEEEPDHDEVVEEEPEPTTPWHERIMSNDGTEPHIIIRRRSINGNPGEHYLLMYRMPPADFFFAWHQRTGRSFQVYGNRWDLLVRNNFRVRYQPGSDGRKIEIRALYRSLGGESCGGYRRSRRGASPAFAAVVGQHCVRGVPR